MKPLSDGEVAFKLNQISRSISITVVLAGILVALSWVFQLQGLNRLHPRLGGMSSHSAFCFTLIGVSLLLVPEGGHARWKRRLSQACAASVVVLSVLTLGDWFEWGFGIGQLFQGSLGTTFPGRMPIATATVFLAFGLGLMLIDVKVRQIRPAEFLSIVATLIALLALIGYSYNLVSFFQLPQRRPLAFHTIFLMLLFSFAILAARPRDGLMSFATSTSLGGSVVRRMLPAAVAVPVFAGWLIMEGQRGGLYAPTLNLAYYTILIIVVFGVLIWMTALSLHRLDIQRQTAEGDVRRLNAELEQRVAERTAQLELANKELEAFSYSVSHDLRAPLRHISGFTQMLAEHYPDDADPTRRRYFGLISDAVIRMGSMIDGLLAFSRMARSELMTTRVNLNALTDDVRGEMRLEQHDIKWIVHPLPEVTGDPAMLKLVFTNLLSNAVKYSSRRTPPVVEVGSSTTDNEVIIYVRDNGVGFDMAYANRLFGVFQRLHRAEEFEGTGIGLANVQRIILRHGGRVWAKSKPDEGAMFYVALPLQVKAQTEESQPLLHVST